MKSLLTLLTFCVCTIPNLLSGATCVWVGGGGNGNWDEPSKWSCVAVPGPGDDVIIATGTNVTRNSSVTVQSLLLQNAGAALTVTGDLTITGLFTWEAGTIAGAGSLICNGGALFQTSSTKTLEDKDLQLNAASTWSGGMIVVPQALPITIGMGAQWEITGADILRPVLGNTGVLVNHGTILKSGGLQTTFEVVDFTNTGTVTVNASILEVRGCSSTGNFAIGPNATLKHYQNAFDLQAGASISGAGAFMIGTAGPSCTIHSGASLSSSVIVNGGTLQLDQNSTIPNLELGTLSSTTVTGAGQLVVTGVTGWNGGTFLNMPAGVQIQGMADLGGNQKTVENCQIEMTGLTTWRDGQIRLGAQGSMIIKCIFDTLVADRNVQQFPTNAPGALFELTGPYLKLGPGTTQINTPFVNNGNVEVHLGNLELEEGESNGDNLLEWSTQLEFHSSEFRIERSLDGNVFSKIGSLPAQGDSYVPTEYFFCDYSAPISAYYRLKMVDLDGTFRYSPVVYVEREDMLVHLYPNPCSQWLEVEMAEPLKIAEYQIHDRRGALVGKGLFHGQSLDLTGLPDGVYTICLLDRSRQLAHRATISKVE